MHVLKVIGAAALVSCVATGAYAADLVMPAAPVGAVAQQGPTGFYAEIYGGADLAGSVNFGGTNSTNLNLGPAFGGAIGWESPEGLAIELDALHTSREWSTVPGYTVTTTSVMVDGKYSFHVTDAVDVYAGAGLGALQYTETSPATNSGWGLGYQLQAGAALKLTDNVSVFGEYRYLNSFSPITVAKDQDQAANNLVLAGLKLSY